MAGALERRRSYFRPGEGWSDDPAGATLRLDVQVREAVELEAVNRLFAVHPDGSFDPLPDDQELSAVERGLSWEAWQTAADGDEFVGFRGRRALTGELANELLGGLAAHDEAGRPLRPGQTGIVFLLSKRDGRTFAERVVAAGGEMKVAEPLAPQAARALARLKELVSQLKELRAADRQTLAAVLQGQAVAAPEFEARTKEALTLFREATELRAACERAAAAQLRQDRTAEERAAAQTLVAEARALAAEVVELREERDRDASEIALKAAEARGERAPALPVSPLLAAARQIADAAERSGIPAERSGAAVRIKVAGGWLELAPDVRYVENE